MRIAAVETMPFALAFREPYVTARGRIEHRELLLARVLADDGQSGIGETASLSLRGGASVAALRREVAEICGPAILGSVLDEIADVRRATATCLEAGASPTAVCAVDIALHDLLGRHRGVPVWRLLAGGGLDDRPEVECNATLAAADPEFVASQAARWSEAGFRTFKLKVGMAGDVAQVAAVRDELGRGARIRVDANGAWSPSEAVLRLQAMEQHGIELAEQPSGDLEDLRLVHHQTAIPIAADESVGTPAEARHARELGACDLVTVKLAKCGGISAAAEVAQALPAYVSSALDGPVGIAAGAHLAIALRQSGADAGIAHGLATQRLFDATVASTGCELQGDRLRLPAGAGLGVALDDEALSARRLDGWRLA